MFVDLTALVDAELRGSGGGLSAGQDPGATHGPHAPAAAPASQQEELQEQQEEDGAGAPAAAGAAPAAARQSAAHRG